MANRKGQVKHRECHCIDLPLPELQKILFDYYEIRTGNPSKVKIEANGKPLTRMQVTFEELLEHDDLGKMLNTSDDDEPPGQVPG